MLKKITKKYWIFKKTRKELDIINKSFFWLDYSKRVRHNDFREKFGQYDLNVVRLNELNDKKINKMTMGSSDDIAKLKIQNSIKNLEKISRLSGKKILDKSLLKLAMKTLNLENIKEKHSELINNNNLNYHLFFKIIKLIDTDKQNNIIKNKSIKGYGFTKKYRKKKINHVSPSNNCTKKYEYSDNNQINKQEEDNNQSLLNVAIMASAV